MAAIPETSTTLLRDLAQDSQHARWGEFVARYRPMMEAFMRERFPALDADDVIQETLIALIKVFPVYHYSPQETGHFRNYLTGILRNKALRQLGKNHRQAKIAEMVGSHVPCDRGHAGRASLPDSADDEQSWRESLLEIALQQLLNDDSIQSRTRQVCLRVAVNGDSPNDVATAFGIERNAVDQIKNRMTARLRRIVEALEKADNA